MGVRASLEHIIGVDVSENKSFSSWYKNKYWENIAEENYLDFTKDLWQHLNIDDEFIEFLQKPYQEKMICDVLRMTPVHEDIDIIGIEPTGSGRENRLYGHDIIYSLIESGVISSERFIKRIPYEDFRQYIGVEPKQVMKEAGFNVANQLLNYKGKWARKYQHSLLDEYDIEFEITYQLLKKLGWATQRDDIQRFLTLDWH